MIPVLETERLRLRPFTLADAARVEELASDRRIAATTLQIPHPYPKGEAAEWISAQRQLVVKGNLYTFAMTTKRENTCIGAITLRVNKQHQRAEIGYWLGVPYWGCGYTSEAARRLVVYGFEELELNRIYASIMVKNEASRKVLVKSGLRAEGVLPKHIKKWGVFEDVEVFGLTREEYARNKGYGANTR